MSILIRIHPNAFNSGNVLEKYKTVKQPLLAKQMTYSAIPPVASSSPQTFRSNINEDGSFPVAPSDSVNIEKQIVVHISPTSGSTVTRGLNYNSDNAEFDPAYGLNVTVEGVELQENMFETAINEPVGSQFLTNLQDLVARGVIEVRDQLNNILTPTQIKAYTAP